MEAHICQKQLHALAKDPTDAVQCIVRGDSSRDGSPALNQFAKPIPLAQSFDNTETALNDSPEGANSLLLLIKAPFDGRINILI